jgi:hypothetical protein
MSIPIATSASPPKARLTFRVGVVGHRPNRLHRANVDILTERIYKALKSVRDAVKDFSNNNHDFFAHGAPRLRALSSLAEGTDRYFAKAALELDYELCCPLPFPREEFENDFKPPKSKERHGANSVMDFRSILDEAGKKLIKLELESESGVDSLVDSKWILLETIEKSSPVVFELDGIRGEDEKAYAAASQVILNQSDLLIVVWDGGTESKPAGTYETLGKALAFHVPVLWIDARDPHPWQMLKVKSDIPSCTSQPCVSGPNEAPDFTAIVDRILRPPQPPANDEDDKRKPDLRTEYFEERKPHRNLWFFWKLFRYLVSFHFQVQAVQVPDPEKVAGMSNKRLNSHYEWADTLADHYADKYRSSFVLCYLFGTLAVMLALLPLLVGSDSKHPFLLEIICSGGEFVAVSSILGLVRWGNRRQWHDRWMAYRLMAELVRQLRFLIPLGGGRPFPRLAPHLSQYGNPSESWMYWHSRSIDREIGLPNERVTPEYLKVCLGYVSQVVNGQIVFHRAAARRSERIDRRLHWLGLGLFGLTFVPILAHFVRSWPTDPNLRIFFAALLPAIGAGVAAIKNQGEFARISKRSRAMAERLEQMNKDLELSRESATALHSSHVAKYALDVAQLMVGEVLDWRVIFVDRPLTPP